MTKTTTNTISKRGIKLEDTAAIQAALDAVNGKATSWTLDVLNVRDLAKKAEAQPDEAGIKKTVKVGATASFYGFAPSAKAYKYAVSSTAMVLKRFPEGWRVMKFARSSMYPGSTSRGEITVNLTQKQYAQAEKNALGHFGKQAI